MIHWTPVIRYQLLVKEGCPDFFAPKVFNLSRKVLTETEIKILERLMNPNLEVILKNSAEGYGLLFIYLFISNLFIVDNFR